MIQHTIRCFVFILLILTGTSCSSLKLAYNWTDVYFDIKIDDYFDVSATQQDFLDIKLKSLHSWHRKVELPKYTAFLQETKHRLQNKVQKDDLTWFFNSTKQFNANIGYHMAADTAEFLSFLSREQIQYLEKKLVEEDEERFEKSKRLPKIRFQEAIEKTLDRTEDWLGELTEEQKIQIKQLWLSYLNTEDGMIRYRHRLRSHQEFVDLLKKHRATDQLQKRLLNWFLYPEVFYSDEYLKMRNRSHQRIEDYILLLDRIATIKQREYLNNVLDNYIKQILELYNVQ